MKQEDEIRRGNEATQVIGNPVFQEIILMMRAQMMDAFQKTNFDQQAERDEIWRMFKIMDSFEANFRSVADTGKMAQVMQDQGEQGQTH